MVHCFEVIVIHGVWTRDRGDCFGCGSEKEGWGRFEGQSGKGYEELREVTR